MSERCAKALPRTFKRQCVRGRQGALIVTLKINLTAQKITWSERLKRCPSFLMQQASETRDSTIACFILPKETLYFSAPPHPHFLCLIQKSHFAEPLLPLIVSEPLSSGEVASSGGTAAHSSPVWTGLSANLSYAICCRCLAAKSRPTLTNPWTVARQAPLSMGFPSQEYWSGLPFPSPGDLPDSGIEPASPALAGGVFTTEPRGKPQT